MAGIRIRERGNRGMVARVVLIGFSATGKSTIGRLLADRLAWSLVDMDEEIERREGVSIPEFFEQQGEAAFRQVERQVFREALRRESCVVSTGGGAVCSDEIWSEIRKDPATMVLRLDASPEEILRRLQEHSARAGAGETTRRPMLDAADPLARIRELLGERETFYRRGDVTIPVEGRTPERIAADAAELVALANGVAGEIALDLPGTTSRILVGPGTRAQLAGMVQERWPSAQHTWLAVDEGVAEYHDVWLQQLGEQFAIPVDTHVVPAGEASKSLEGLSGLYDWMLDGGVERGDVAIAAGGGVTGDLMGFAASTVLRGIGLVQVPTTLLSMVDSSVGGKTGINHPGGKNLIGAFYQPSIVVVDPVFLTSLPERELRSGFAEIIKHGVIQASTPGGEKDFLYRVLERNADRLVALEEPLTSWVIRQNIALKAAVVAADEREARLRQILNFGHTMGHGIEAAGYSLLHGEAVAVGMVAAITIAARKGLVPDTARERLEHLVAAYGLPVSADVDPSTVRQKMTQDKKKSAGAQQWIMPVTGGGVEIRTDVDDADIDAALESVLGALV